MSGSREEGDAPMMSNDERLVYMLNQIARNFQTMGDEGAAALATADHVTSFWDPRMKTRIHSLAASDPTILSPIATAALAIQSRGAPTHQTPATEFAGVNEIGPSDAG